MPSIDVKRLKDRVTYTEVLDLLGWEHVRIEAGRRRGPCPVHRSTRPRSDSFAVCPLGWTCHSCKRHGDQLALWLEATRQAFLPGVLDLCQKLGIEVPYLPRGPRTPRAPRTEKRPRQGGDAGGSPAHD